MKKLFSLCLMLCLVMSLPLVAEDVAYDAQALDFIEENIEKAFITGKTSYLIEGRMISEPTDVYNHLELVSYHVEPDGESVILTGTVGEEWVTPVSKVRDLLSILSHIAVSMRMELLLTQDT